MIKQEEKEEEWYVYDWIKKGKMIEN